MSSMSVCDFKCLFFFKSPKRFEEAFEELISFLEQAEHWEETEKELVSRGVSLS